ncbi:MAG: START domain-containing protein [Verrucomicrobiota bacterium]|nr:START domain-containing protein [Verrucomicrobiota bacterium]
MHRYTTPFIGLLFCASAFAAEEWKDDSNNKGVLIQSRAHLGTSLLEFRAVGTVDAPTRRVFAVLDDTAAYPSFMPYVASARLLKREENAVVVYQRLDLPLVQDRDYTLRTRFEKAQTDAGPVYRMRWTPVNELGPAASRGVVRVNECEGGWLLEPLSESSTRATYTIFTDSGGALPAFLENSGSRIAIRKLFEAIRKQVHAAKYATE